MSVEAPTLALAFGSVAPPQGDVVSLNVHLGCTKEVCSFEATLQNWNGKYSPNGAYPISVGLDGNISLGRGSNCPLLLTCRVESIKYQSTPLESYVTVSGRCWGEKLFRKVVSKTYENKKGEEIIKDLMDYYAGLSHVRGSTELVEATDTTYTKLEFNDTPVMDILRQISDSADKAGAIGYDFRSAPDGKFEFFAKNSKWWIDNGLVAYLPLDEASGSAVYDHSGKGNNGTVTGATWTDGKFGKALSFVASAGNKVTLPSPVSLAFGSGSFSLFAWVKIASFDHGDRVTVIGGSNSNAPALCVMASTSHLGFFQMTNIGQNSSLDVPLNAWAFLGIIVNRSTNIITFYVNGASEEQTISSSFLAFTAINGLGTYLNLATRYMDGLIDEVRIYNSALSSTEAQNLFACGPPPLTEKMEKIEYSKEISRVRNKITVYGASDKSVPTDKDAWTESLRPTDGGWTATSGSITFDTSAKIMGTGSVKTSATNLYCAACLLTLDSGKEVNANLYPTLNLWLNLDPAFNGNATVTLYDTSNRFAAHEFTVGSEKWFQTQLAVGSANADLWQVQTDFNWTQIKKVAVSCWFVGLGSGSFWVDGLFFGGRQYSSLQEDAASQGNYGLREIVEVNEELCSDTECESHAKAVLSNLKDPAESLTISSTVINYGTTPILAGDKIQVFLPNEGVSGDFRVLSVEYGVDGKTQTLEMILELGREKPLLADYVYALRSRIDHLSKYKISKRGN